MAVSDSNFPFDDNDGCDLSYLDDVQLLGKVRRENSCQNPKGQRELPNDSDKSDPFNFARFAETQMSRIFPKFVEICPTNRFGTSNTPVCKDILDGGIVQTPGVLSVTLLNVAPSTFNSYIFIIFISW